MKYASIITENKGLKTNQVYTYRVPKKYIDSLKIGMRVLIPFGRGNKIIKGIVVAIKDEFEGKFNLKEIIDIIDPKPLLDEEMIEISRWLSEYYLCSYLDSINVVLPPGNFKEINVSYKLTKEDIKSLNIDERNILNLIKSGKNSWGDLKKQNIKNMSSLIEELEKKGYIETIFDIKTKIKSKTEKYIRLKSSEELDYSLISRRAKKQKKTLDFLKASNKNEFNVNSLLKDLNISSYIIDELENKGFIESFQKQVYRNPIKKKIDYYEKFQLNSEQELAVREFLTSNYDDYLLHGVTGSGKTEVYLQIVENMLEQGKDSIILVPEISLTPQTINRFVGRFGDRVAVMHSKLSYGERFDEWKRIKNGQVKIVVGARSAIFAPFKNLGLIIIDEEHETSYKSSMNPKYNAIEVGKKRIQLNPGAKLLRGTATPDISSYYSSLLGEVKLLELKTRVNQKEMPYIDLVDMREELNIGNMTMFSRKLFREIKARLDRKEQVILFLNRRGFSTFISCRQCGYVVKCNECDVSMTYHYSKNICKCHYCGLTKKPPKVCPDCGSKYIKYFGVGTEQVERFTREVFPKARVARMDLDSVSRKGSYDKILNSMAKHEIDILIGTQMIAKGLDFKNVTLVGVIAADTSLNLPDFRAPERTFQLITQVAGRAGRALKEGLVVVQTYNPDHYSIEMAQQYNYKEFFQMELDLRREFKYPPYVKMILITIFGEKLKEVEQISKIVGQELYKSIKEEKINCKIIGPYPAALDKIRNNYRYQIILKSSESSIDLTKELVRYICIDNILKLNYKSIKFNIDVDPISVL